MSHIKSPKKTNKKMIRMIEAGADKEELARHADSLTKQASKQLAVLTYFIGGGSKDFRGRALQKRPIPVPRR